MALVPSIKRAESRFLDTIKELTDPRPMISDAYWSATHPVDRMTGKGRSSGPQMLMYPWGAKFPPKSFAVGPASKGLTAHRLPLSPEVPLTGATADTMTWRGNLIRTGYYQGIPRGMPRDAFSRAHFSEQAGSGRLSKVRQTARKEQGVPISYNIVDKEGKLVGATHLRLFDDATEVDEIFLKGEHRGSPEILKDMVGPAIDRGLPIRAVPGNPKVGRLLERLSKTHHKGEGRPPVRADWNPSSTEVPIASARVNVGPPRQPPVHAARNSLIESLTHDRPVVPPREGPRPPQLTARQQLEQDIRLRAAADYRAQELARQRRGLGRRGGE